MKVLHKVVWRPALVHRLVGPRGALEFPISEPEFFSDSGHAGEIVNAVMRHEHFVMKARIVVVAFDPIDHIAAVTRSRGPDAILIHVRKIRRHGDAIADVGEDLAAPITGNLSEKALAITG